MSKFCGKCGAALTAEGNCPNCEPNPSHDFVVYKDGETVSFEIPKSQGNTVYAQNSGNLSESANLPQNQPPVKYEGNVPMPDFPPVTNVPPIPGQNPNVGRSPNGGQSPNGGKPPKRKSRKKNSKGIAVKLVCILLVIAVLSVGLGVILYKDVLYVPNVSESLKVTVDNKIYGEEREHFVITGSKISSKQITDEDTAKKAAKEFTEELGYERIADGYVLINTSTVGGYTYYRFQERYENYPVIGRTMTIIADADGNSCGVSTNVIDIDKNLNTDIPDFEKQKVIDALNSFAEASIEVNVNSYTKSIYSFEHCDKPLLAYEVLAVVNNRNFRLFVDPNGGKIINAYCLDSAAQASELEGNGKDMPNNPQKFNGQLHGNLFVTSDPERNISVYNADRGSSTIVIEYIDSDKNSYYNRRFDLDNADNAPDEEICVIYDEDGEYYEYDSVRGVFVKDDIELGFDDLKFEGYTVYNLNTDKSHPLHPVSSSDKKINDELAVRLMVKTAQTYDFFSNVLGRKGYDGEDGTMMAVCNDNLSGSGEQAFSAGDNNGFSMITFGFENPMEWDDVAHEYTHSVEQSVSALNYQNESGAIMEAYSDVFGEIVEDYCYETYMGADLSSDNFNYSCDWISGDRKIFFPYADENPAKYQDRFFDDKMDEDKWEESNLGMNNDFGSVHKNSTVISHAAYLMTMSGNEDENLSMEELANLWYRTLFILPSDCTFSQLRDCMELQADRMLDSEEITEEQRNNISNSFDKVNIQSTRYSENVKIVVRSDNSKGKYKVKIEGKKFELLTVKDYSNDFELTNGVELEDGLFEYSETLELKDGRYTIRVSDEDDKATYFDREILVMTNDKNPQYNPENKNAVFYFEEIKEPEMPDTGTAAEAAPGDAGGEIPDTDMPSKAPEENH